MANPKKPTQLKVIHGTFRKDRAPKKEPEPKKVTVVPRPPAHLTKYGKKLWKSLAAELVEKGVLTVVDLPALEVCCDAYGIYRAAKEAVFQPVDPVTRKKGKRTLAEYLRGKNSQTHPEYTAMTRAFYFFKAYLIEFGLTPSSRSKLDLPEPKGNKQDPMEKLWNEA